MSDGSVPIDATPTKEFFIYMLVRDVPLIRAIVDLIDNSLDGAHRVVAAEASAHSPERPLEGFHVALTINKEKLEVVDNCGGIPYETARDYAFRFGRAPDAPFTSGSIGQFGVGMKRTIFKAGNYFTVHSLSAHSTFTMAQDVRQWLRKPEWNFDFQELDTDVRVPPEKCGTTISVTDLHPGVAELVERTQFINELRNELEQAHATSLKRGFSISVNGVPLGIAEFELLCSDSLVPAYVALDVPPRGGSAHGVSVRIYAGLSKERSLERGGWYVFCNGRQVLVADQSSTTGWMSQFEDEETRLPKYHADFAYFRGFAFFESNDASLLPWTTTKTGVDADSPVFRAARREMMRVMRPITKFLRELANEAHDDAESTTTNTPLADAMHTASSTSYEQITQQGAFVAPKRQARTQRDVVKVQYDLSRAKLDIAQARLKATSAKQVGEMTFDYFFQAECQ